MVCAKLEPVGRYGTFPASEDADGQYEEWLTRSGRCDPAFDEVTLPYYHMVVESPLVAEAERVSVQVDIVRSGRSPLLRMKTHEGD